MAYRPLACYFLLLTDTLKLVGQRLAHEDGADKGLREVGGKHARDH